LSAVVRILRALVEATPAPASGSDPSALVSEADVIMRDRVPLLQQLETALAAESANDEAEALRFTLDDRDARWQAALTVARRAMGQRVSTASRYRR
jgi:hypothetical protein